MPASRACAEPRVDELDRADVDAARRLRGEQHLKVAPHLAGDDDLLLVAAGECARRQERIGGADVERLDLPPRVLEDPLAVEAQAIRESVLLAEYEIFGDRVV